ncbi:MAG: antitoxin [Rhodomicrobium sp.]
MDAVEGKTIKQYALEKLFPPALDEEQAWADLKTVIARRIAESASGAVSGKTFDDIVEEELGAIEAA